MKRFVLSCCILAVTSTMVFAQAAKNSAGKGTSTAKQVHSAASADFTTKINAFEAGVTRNNQPVADQKFTELKQMVGNDMAAIKTKIRDAANETEKKKWTNLMIKKQDIYTAVISAASDMHGNLNVMVAKLKEYAATL